MPNVGWPELLVVLVIALVIFGPKRLPDMGRQLGKGLREFRKATSEIQDHFDLSLEDKNEQKDGGAQAAAAPVATSFVTETPVATSFDAETPVATSFDAETPVATVPVAETPAATVPVAETPVESTPPTPDPVPDEASAVQAPDVVDGEVLREETGQPAHTVGG